MSRGMEREGVEEGILIRFVGKGGVVFERDVGLLSVSSKWLRTQSELDTLGLPENIVERVRVFWRSQDQVLYLKLDDLENNHTGTIIVERMVERRHLFVFGAGHVGRSIALMGLLVGMETTLIDDRQEFLVRDVLAGYKTHTLLVDFASIRTLVPMNEHSVVVIVTRGHQSDEIILRQVADYNPGYVGMIGSRRRVESVYRRLKEQGVSEAFLKRVKAPIGLDIGARTPQEIAVAVHAEIIKHFRGADS